MDKLIRLPEVQEITGAKRSSIYAWVLAKKFPKPIKCSERSVAWLESEVLGWVSERIQKSRGSDTHSSATNISTQI